MKTYNSWEITDPRTFDEAKTMTPKIFIVQPAEVPVQFYGLQSLEFETLGEDKALTHVGQVFKLIHSHLMEKSKLMDIFLSCQAISTFYT